MMVEDKQVNHLAINTPYLPILFHPPKAFLHYLSSHSLFTRSFVLFSSILNSCYAASSVMKSFQIAAALTAFGRLVAAAPSPNLPRAVSSIVTGTPFGFASSVTGGGTVAPVYVHIFSEPGNPLLTSTIRYPTTIAELKSYLTSSEPQNIVISGTFDFVGSEGTETIQACNIYDCTPAEGGQGILNTLGGCSGYSLYDATIDIAGYQGIQVTSDKTLGGTGSNTVLNGKGLRLVGVSNTIIQNIEITNLNPMYVWGGDAISFPIQTKSGLTMLPPLRWVASIIVWASLQTALSLSPTASLMARLPIRQHVTDTPTGVWS
jgi:hypothetical protein